MIIGCVKELNNFELRVGMTPQNVKEYINHNHTVYIEKGAGLGASFTDEDYTNHGGIILDTAKEVWQKSQMIIKVKEPIKSEYSLMREGQILYTYLHLAASEVLTNALLKAKTKAVAYETLEDENGHLPLLKPMSEIAGRLSIQVGARFLEAPAGGMGVLLGGVTGVKKAHVVIIGAGVVGSNACRAAVGFGAIVTVIDKNLDRLTYLDDLYGSKIQTQFSTDTAIEEALKQADLVIGSVLIPGAFAPKLVKRRHLPLMKKGSVIVDVAIDQGGSAETSRPTTHQDPTFIVDDVIHYCVTNMPGAVSMTSTMALTNATLNTGLKIADNGLEKAILKDKLIATGVNCYDGKITNKSIAKHFGLPFVDIFNLI